ncbi:hypothetical protein DFH07DRAFT_923476 [Mycena maculata]|uniref:Carbohydrate-binding module family 19 domain-containing protein n=1 Tax=Mycena maculata TaxID=230809 RepID=A0AAD7IQN4_9AGAR|nr:hypothetical protein DFH07DRAFT_923476 [Mycena maculata]
MHGSTAFITLALAAAASARPARFGRRQSFNLANGQAAIALNAQFATLTATSPCTAGEDACVNQQFAQCVNGAFVIQPCAATTICAALPLTNAAGTTVTCTTQSDLDARIAATGATAAGSSTTAAAAASTSVAAADNTTATPPPADNTTATPPPADNSGSGSAADLQTSLTLDPSVIAAGFTNDGQNPPVAGQTASSTSTNNYINFCALTLPGTPLTNGAQITTGSCNPAPIGLIPAVDKMPSAKYLFPTNGATIAANTAFNATLNINNLVTGVFTNAALTYFAAPQTLDSTGLIIGHSHMVIEALTSLDQTTPTDPQKFAFFKGVDTAAVNGVLTVAVSAGLPAGAYRICSINSSTNHQPVIVPIAQHGSLDDCSYFTAQ